ncbi:MAG TPA: dihydrodipicolinate synthase family protein [Symbiobacteriaceae bacterium]|jgi:4-hydroxy-tetrahydrodipicolinate synthase|nr:dihydrodipicolinate synthase family protein [Symbiobacteriaceae bacterium]
MKLHGVIPAVLTPFTAEGRVDEQALRTYIDFLIGAGVHGLFPLGTNGAGPLLSIADRQLVAAAVVSQAAKRVPVVIHTGAISTEETVALTRHAHEIGADAAAVVAPWYFPHDDKALEAHFSAVAEAVPGLDLYLYNIPGNAKNDLKPALVKRLAERYSNIRGVKDSSKDLGRLQDYISALGSDRAVVVGTDALVVPALLMGATGVVSAIGNCLPKVMVDLYEAFRQGDTARAVQLQYRANQVRDALKTGPYITGYMEALRLQGLDLGHVKAPLRELTAEEAARLAADLRKLAVIPG